MNGNLLSMKHDVDDDVEWKGLNGFDLVVIVCAVPVHSLLNRIVGFGEFAWE